ncbi:MAG: hypothetical protein ACD_37C00596G0006 [uncultured bacterium]|nr:MAG: hypothetical protein ACD_37C00596G0006 [uncultured bacterium]
MTNTLSNLFLDTVDINYIRKYKWLIRGVTTTPTFFKKSGVDYKTFVENLRKEFRSIELHIEALAENSEETENYLKELIKKDWFEPNKVIIKIPVTMDNLKIIFKYSKEGIKFNAHLIFNSSQAYLAASAGATYVCPLIGRYADEILKDDVNKLRGGKNDPGKILLTDVIDVIKDRFADSTKVMASSIRSLSDFENSIKENVDFITISPKNLELFIQHEFTAAGIQRFLEDMSK